MLQNEDYEWRSDVLIMVLPFLFFVIVEMRPKLKCEYWTNFSRKIHAERSKFQVAVGYACCPNCVVIYAYKMSPCMVRDCYIE